MTTISSAPPSPTLSSSNQNKPTKEELFDELKAATTLDEQKALVEKLCGLHNFAIDDVIDESSGGRLIDMAVMFAWDNNDR